MRKFSRRDLFSRSSQLAGAGIAASLLPGVVSATASDDAREGGIASEESFRYCLNTSTISGQKVGLVKEVEIAATAGYTGIEPWMGEIENYVKEGGSLKDLSKRVADAGLTVESAIGFADWLSDDDTQRAAGLEQAKRDMGLVRQIGGTRIAAPPTGGRGEKIDLDKCAARYRALLELGKKEGVAPQLEVWGFSATLSKLSETAYVAVEAGHPDACLLLDVYHLHKGGSDFDALKLLSGGGQQVFHVNDYPADPPRESINDSHRVFCGDGVAPLTQILRDLVAVGFRGALSLELFNRDYWQRDALAVAREGLEKTKAAVQRAMESS